MAATANAYALLGDGDDDVQQLAEKAAPLIKAEKAVAPAAAKPEKPDGDAQPRADGGRGGRGDRGRGDRGGRVSRGGGRGGRFGDQNGALLDQGTEEGGGDRGRGRGYRGRGGRGGDGLSRPPRREYERRDGTGRGHEGQKRGGAGIGNWGTEGEDVKPAYSAAYTADEAPKAEGEADATPATEFVPVEDAAAAAPEPEVAPEPEAEPEKPEMTLEEYEKEQAAKKVALNKVAEVKAVSMDDFKGMKTYVRKDIEEQIPGIETTKKKVVAAPKEEQVKDAKPVKQTVEVGFRIADGSENTGRGEGRGRGGRGRGEGRGDRGDRPFSGRGRGEGRGDGEGRGFGGRGGDRGEGGNSEGRGFGGRGGGDRPYSARGRGEGRPFGGRGRGGAEIPINDASAFPSLG